MSRISYDNGLNRLVLPSSSRKCIFDLVKILNISNENLKDFYTTIIIKYPNKITLLLTKHIFCDNYDQ
jgi:hypothetical protein